MGACVYRKQGNFSLTCETLEERQLLSANISAFPAAEVRAVARAGPLDRAPSLFIEPQAGRAPIMRAINAARSEIRLGICNLSDPQIGDALAAAVARGVNVEVIADHDDYYNGSSGVPGCWLPGIRRNSLARRELSPGEWRSSSLA